MTVELTVKGDIERLHLGEEDIVVVSIEEVLDPEEACMVAESVRHLTHHEHVMVVHAGMKVSVLEGES